MRVTAFSSVTFTRNNATDPLLLRNTRLATPTQRTGLANLQNPYAYAGLHNLQNPYAHTNLHCYVTLDPLGYPHAENWFSRNRPETKKPVLTNVIERATKKPA